MTYEPYITVDSLSSSSIPNTELRKAIVKASRHIDTLTFNRIVGRFSELTDFQKEIVKEVCKELTEWEYENAEMLSSVLKSYSLGGVSMEFDGSNVEKVNGVYIPTELYGRLRQTGLCSLRI